MRRRKHRLPYPLYDVGLYDAKVSRRAPVVRLARLQTFRDVTPAPHANYRTSLQKILILRHLPPAGPATPVYIPLNHSFPPSICFPEHLIHWFLDRGTVQGASITNTHLPWLGDPPLIIAFREEGPPDVLYATVLFGRCTSYTTNGTETGSLWATFHGNPSRQDCADWGHQCPADHVLSWPGLKKRFVLMFHTENEPMGGRIAKWWFDIAFTISLTTGALILTQITLGYRALHQHAGYLDMFEGNEELMRGAQAFADEARRLRRQRLFPTRKEATRATPHLEIVSAPQKTHNDTSHSRPLENAFPLHLPTLSAVYSTAWPSLQNISLPFISSWFLPSIVSSWSSEGHSTSVPPSSSVSCMYPTTLSGNLGF